MTKRTNRKTVYAVQTFSRVKGGVAIDLPMPAQSEKGALAMMRRLAPSKVATVAFSRTGDPECGEFDPPVIIEQTGELPYDLRDMG